MGFGRFLGRNDLDEKEPELASGAAAVRARAARRGGRSGTDRNHRGHEMCIRDRAVYDEGPWKNGKRSSTAPQMNLATSAERAIIPLRRPRPHLSLIHI